MTNEREKNTKNTYKTSKKQNKKKLQKLCCNYYLFFATVFLLSHTMTNKTKLFVNISCFLQYEKNQTVMSWFVISAN